ncbi:MAG: hypothetical protein AVDCRST_MAG41-1805, partial [uncultured Corynebacteriales bacterium]
MPSTIATTEPPAGPPGRTDTRWAAGLATLVALPLTLVLVLLAVRAGGGDPRPAPTPA